MQKQVLIGWKELCAGLSLGKTIMHLIRGQVLLQQLKKRSHKQRDR
jgi:hypothetical protein